MSKQLLEKLEKYEEEAYEGGYGSDWLGSVGEGFKFYIEKCIDDGTKPSIKGFEKYIDTIHGGNK